MFKGNNRVRLQRLRKYLKHFPAQANCYLCNATLLYEPPTGINWKPFIKWLWQKHHWFVNKDLYLCPTCFKENEAAPGHWWRTGYGKVRRRRRS